MQIWQLFDAGVLDTPALVARFTSYSLPGVVAMVCLATKLAPIYRPCQPRQSPLDKTIQRARTRYRQNKPAYESGTHEQKRQAARGLSCRPYRSEAKEVYLQMLDERTQKGEAGYECCQACVEFNWTEAIPLFERVRVAPKSLRSYDDAVSAIRRLSGKPVAASVRTALKTIFAADPDRHEGQQPGGDLTSAKQVLSTSDDYAICILYAIRIYTHEEYGKGGLSDKQRAESEAGKQLSLEILGEMPRDRTLAEVKRLAELLPKDVQLQELVQHLSER